MIIWFKSGVHKNELNFKKKMIVMLKVYILAVGKKYLGLEYKMKINIIFENFNESGGPPKLSLFQEVKLSGGKSAALRKRLPLPKIRVFHSKS